MAFRLDLHTHSIVSRDGGITARQYEHILSKKLDYVAITDHDVATTALEGIHKIAGRIIPGQEISTAEGDFIGLYMEETVPAGLGLEESIGQVKSQGGLVYVPHPWEKWRRGLQSPELEKYKSEFDIIEVFNARSKRRVYSELATHFAQTNGIAMASSSDAHRAAGVGSAYTVVEAEPTRENLVELLKNGRLVCKYASLRGHLYPLVNKLLSF